MRFKIEHEIPGRVKVNLHGHIDNHDQMALSELIEKFDGVTGVTVYPRTGCIAIRYDGGQERRDALLAYLCCLSVDDVTSHQVSVALTKPADRTEFAAQIIELVGCRIIKRFILPKPIAAVVTVIDSVRFIAKGIKSLVKGHLDTPVLDAAAVTISLVQGDFRTAGTTMFLLTLGDKLEELTRKRSQDALVDSLLDIPTSAWKVDGDHDIQVDINDIELNDLVRVRMGSRIPVDGTIVEGTANINQATLTGEPLAVPRTVSDDVFAGTVVEDGEIVIKTSVAPRETKLRQIGNLVEQSESLKGETESRMTAMADKLVPWNFALALVVWLVTRNVTKLSAALMVDYSCALKFAGSIASLTAMREGAQHGFTVKGASAFEKVAKADTVVFDKTGTLTNGEPHVNKVIAVSDAWDEDEVLRLSACLEEHFPHPVARAVVNAAAERDLKHRERHAEVEYIVAHGIASSVDGHRVVIGSSHFVFEDEHIPIDETTKERIGEQIGTDSTLWLAVNGELAGVISIDDPLRPGIKEQLDELRELGIDRIIMLTGDNEATAARIAEQAGIAEFHANLLPEEKHEYLTKLKDEGQHVIMVGDGVNDSPALSLADVGVAMGDGAAIAREVADVTLSRTSLDSLVRLRRLSCAYTLRLNGSFGTIIALNSALLALGIAGVIAPTVSSLIHNSSTVLLSLSNSRTYLREDADEDAENRA